MIAYFGDFLSECREDRSQLVVDSRIGAVFPDRMHSEVFASYDWEGDWTSDHLASSFVETAINNDLVFHACNKRIINIVRMIYIHKAI